MLLKLAVNAKASHKKIEGSELRQPLVSPELYLFWVFFFCYLFYDLGHQLFDQLHSHTQKKKKRRADFWSAMQWILSDKEQHIHSWRRSQRRHGRSLDAGGGGPQLDAISRKYRMDEVAQSHQSCCLEEVATFDSLNDQIGWDCGYVARKLPFELRVRWNASALWPWEVPDSVGPSTRLKYLITFWMDYHQFFSEIHWSQTMEPNDTLVVLSLSQ